MDQELDLEKLKTVLTNTIVSFDKLSSNERKRILKTLLAYYAEDLD